MDLKALVADKLKTNTTDVKDKVVDFLYQEELNKRVQASLKVIEKIDAAEKEIKKVKPDVETFDGEGNPLPGVFSKEKHNQVKTLKENRDKLVAALDAAISTNDFTKVLELGK